MNNKILDEFGEILMRSVRDRTISEWDRILDGKMKGSTAQKVLSRLEGFTEEQKDTLKWLLPQIVDFGLDNLLVMLEECRSINVVVVNHDGESGNIRELSDGLAGDLYGWIPQFSKERYEKLY